MHWYVFNFKNKVKKKKTFHYASFVCMCMQQKFHHHSNSWMTSPASANVCRDTFVHSGYNIDSFIFTSCFCIWLLLIIIMIILFLLRKLTKNAHSLRSSKPHLSIKILSVEIKSYQRKYLLSYTHESCMYVA